MILNGLTNINSFFLILIGMLFAFILIVVSENKKLQDKIKELENETTETKYIKYKKKINDEREEWMKERKEREIREWW